MTKSLVDRLRNLRHSGAVTLIKKLNDEELRENFQDLVEYREEIKQELNTLNERFILGYGNIANGKEIEIHEDFKIKYDTKFMKLNPNEILNKITPSEYLQDLSNLYNIKRKELNKRRITGNNPKVERAYREACYTLKTRFHISLPEIGKILGGKDHSTIINAIKHICDELGREYSSLYNNNSQNT